MATTSRERTGELDDLDANPNELRPLWDDSAAVSVRIDLERLLLDVLVSTPNRSQPREAFCQGRFSAARIRKPRTASHPVHRPH